VKGNGALPEDLADGKGYIRFLVKLADTKEPNYGFAGVRECLGQFG
jgi:hypothetical protein